MTLFLEMDRVDLKGVPGELQPLPPPLTQIRRRRPTPATLVLTSDQSSPGNPKDKCREEGSPCKRVGAREEGQTRG